MWVRGLKLAVHVRELTGHESHPMWVRGLKQPSPLQNATNMLVAPYVGAWIETSLLVLAIRLFRSHPMWVRGLKRAI